MNIVEALARIAGHGHLDQDEMYAAMREVMTGGATPAQIGAFLMGLRMKGESIEEITGAAQAMRELATGIEVDQEYLVDTCGTGGDGQNLFNVSTASAFVVAAAGGRVAKHGNYGVSSASGSADLLLASGARLDLTPAAVARAIEEVGVGFLFAPGHHSAMKHAVAPRRELGMRTLFNMLGPLTNPAGVRRQVVGVFAEALCEPLARVLGRLGSQHVLVVHARDGLDEISLAAPTTVAELKDGQVQRWTLNPEDVGVEMQTLNGLAVDSPEQSLALIQSALGGAAVAGVRPEVAARAADMVALNAGAALYAAGRTETIAAGVEQARAMMASGRAQQKLRDYAQFSQENP